MNKKILLILLLLVSLTTQVAFANSAEPPGLIIYCYGGPLDLQIYYVTDDSEVELYKQGEVGEVLFKLYLSDIPGEGVDNKAKFHIVSSKGDYYLDIDDMEDEYYNLYRLSFNKRTLSKGANTFRAVLLVGIRITMTIIIEGTIYFLFGYRKKATWKAFLIINLITQGALNIWFGLQSVYMGGLLFVLILAEIIILIVEAIYMLKHVVEMNEGCMILTVIVANMTSFYLGFKLIPLLPI